MKPAPPIIQFKQELTKATNKKGVLNKWMKKSIKCALHPNTTNHTFVTCFTAENICKDCNSSNDISQLSIPVTTNRSVANTPLQQSIVLTDSDNQSELSIETDTSYKSLTSSNDGQSYIPSSNTVVNIAGSNHSSSTINNGDNDNIAC